MVASMLRLSNIAARALCCTKSGCEERTASTSKKAERRSKTTHKHQSLVKFHGNEIILGINDSMNGNFICKFMLQLNWGSSKIQKLMFSLRWLIYAYGALALVLVLVHVSSPDPVVTAFPTKCTSRFGCSRVAEMDKHHAAGLKPPRFQAPLNETLRIIEGWISDQNGASILYDNSGFIHARFVSFFFGFADDFYVRVRCVPSLEHGHPGDGAEEINADGHLDDSVPSELIVEVQGQLRIGRGDLRVNALRNQRFINWLNQARQDLPAVPCLSK